MFVKSLLLSNFRNYDSQTFHFSKDINIIYGMNAQGKTNILEAIFLCASGRSHRTGKDFELVKFGEDYFYIKLLAEKQLRDLSIEIGYRKDDKKKLKINESPAARLGELYGNLNAIIFSPEDLMIVKEGPAERRKFIDISISQLKPTYFYDLQQTAKILQHRNGLLKELQINRSLFDMLDIWNSKFIETGSRIMLHRNNYISKIGELISEIHYKITGGKEKIQIQYQPSFQIGDAGSIDEITLCFEKAINQISKKELIKAVTLIGPQRDDMNIKINGLDVKLYGSQGQQRTAVLSLKLAELELMRNELGDSPILLLDDVLSELDHERQKFLLDFFADHIQTFITCTEKNSLDKYFFENTTYFNIEKGHVV